MLYKKMFDDLVAGITTKETIARHIKLHLQKRLGSDVLSLARVQNISTETLDELLDYLLSRLFKCSRHKIILCSNKAF